jgi:hypothetical protein
MATPDPHTLMLKPSKGSTSFPIGAQRGYALCEPEATDAL